MAQSLDLRHNPFLRTFSEIGGTQVANQATNNFDLRAVLYDDDKPLVNIGGVILGLGEKIEGYELVAVSRVQATLSKDGRDKVLRLNEEVTDFSAQR